MAKIQSKWIENNSIKIVHINTEVAGAGLTGGGGSPLAVGTGNGIEVTADAISAKADTTSTATTLANAINVGSNGIAIKVDDATIAGTGASVLSVKTGGIGVTQLSTSVAGNGLTGGGGSALSIDVNSTVSFGTSASWTFQQGSGAGLFVANDPISDTHVANKLYVDSVAAGLDPKQSVKAASTSELSAANYYPAGTTIGKGVIVTCTQSGGTLGYDTTITLGTSVQASIKWADSTTNAASAYLAVVTGTFTTGNYTFDTGTLTVSSVSSTNGVHDFYAGMATGAFGSLDGITISVNDRILIKDQSDPKQNGIFTLDKDGNTNFAYILRRASDQNGQPSSEVSGGNFAFVESGSVNEGSGWVLTGAGTLTLNTDNLNWVQFSAAYTLLAGDGLTKTGNILHVGAGNGITVNADNITVKLDTAIDRGTNHGSGPALSLDTAGLSVKLDTDANGGNGAGLSVASGGLSVKVDGTSIKVNTDNQLTIGEVVQQVSQEVFNLTTAVSSSVFTGTIGATNTPRALRLNMTSEEVASYIMSDFSNTIEVTPVGGPEQLGAFRTNTYSLSTEGGPTTITFSTSNIIGAVGGISITPDYGVARIDNFNTMGSNNNFVFLNNGTFSLSVGTGSHTVVISGLSDVFEPPDTVIVNYSK